MDTDESQSQNVTMEEKEQNNSRVGGGVVNNSFRFRGNNQGQPFQQRRHTRWGDDEGQGQGSNQTIATQVGHRPMLTAIKPIQSRTWTSSRIDVGQENGSNWRYEAEHWRQNNSGLSNPTPRQFSSNNNPFYQPLVHNNQHHPYQYNNPVPAYFHPQQQQQQYFQTSQIPHWSQINFGLFEARDWGNSINQRHFSTQSQAQPLSMDIFPRTWEDVQKSSNTKDSTGDDDGVRISVMSYNILAPTLQQDHHYLYKDCDPRAISWSYRQRCFFKEIEFYNPDIVCLQEVEANLLQEYNDFFGRLGYSGTFKKRTGDKCDGCSIYYRDNHFKLIDSISVEYLQNSMVPLLNRDNVGLIVKLETQNTGQRIVIGTTHLLFNKRRTDVKIGQALLFLAELDRLACYGNDSNGVPMYYPTIVCGDYNVEPSHAVNQLFSQGKIFVDKEFMSGANNAKSIPSKLGITHQPIQHDELKLQRLQKQLSTKSKSDSEPNNSNIELYFEYHTRESDNFVNLPISKHHFHGQNEYTVQFTDGSQSYAATVELKGRQNDDSIENNKEKTTPHDNQMSHEFNFKDVYDAENGEDENYVTTKHNKWVRVDYMYYSTKSNNDEGELKLLRRLKLPTRRECTSLKKIPCPGNSSDHFPLVGLFLLKKPVSQ